MTDSDSSVAWALKILEREPDYEQNLISKYAHEICMGLLFTAVPVVSNAAYKRPLWAGIQAHILFAAFGLTVGRLLSYRERDVLATRDAKLRDYIMRHPEDFPPPERLKYADVFIPWVPMR